MEIWTGFIVGLFGSLHCIGMCGPIVLALPVIGDSQLKILAGRVLYNLGRIFTYTLMGALFGLFGSRLVLFGLQQDLSIAFGVIILVYVLTPRKIKARVANTFIYRETTNFIKSKFSLMISKKSNSSLFTIGVLNGLLPCGFVYVGIAGAVSTVDWISGALYMAMFGLGTFPVMLATAMFGKIINVNFKRKVNKLIPVFAVLLALIFILRGLNLGIPYLSPKLQKTVIEQPESCH
ncbi:MAG: sulfite exporter TauE/SafE family protein [Melioribacter sp.]|nr:sulfite exporter TauE/SafE family protein [Melioribacter sp.]